MVERIMAALALLTGREENYNFISCARSGCVLQL